MTSLTLRPVAVLAAEPLDDPHYLPADPANLLHADPKRREAVSFDSDGIALAGHLYRPTNARSGSRLPAVVMCGPISSVKEQTVPHYAERLADAGYNVLTFDPRGFGESAVAPGRPRWHYDPSEIIADYAGAASFLLSHADVDSARVAAVGVCMGGGYAVSLGARDKRLKAIVSVGGGYSIGGTFQQLMGVDAFAGATRAINDLVQRGRDTGETQYIPTIAHAPTPEQPIVVMPNEEAFSYYDRTAKADAPNWSYRMTAASLEPYYLYNAVAHAPLVAPTPLLIVHGTRDLFLLPEYAQDAYDAAKGTKQLSWIETHNHIELYDQDPYVTEAVKLVCAFLDRHLPTE